MATNQPGAEAFLDVEGACRLLGVSRPTLYLWMKSGELAYAQLGGRRRIRRVDLDRFVEERMVARNA